MFKVKEIGFVFQYRGFPVWQLLIRNPTAFGGAGAIRNPKSTIRNPQSEIKNPISYL